MDCPFCKRSDVDSAQQSNRNLVNRTIAINKNAITYFSVDGMCVDCAAVAEHFLRKGLLAFRKALESYNPNQLDLFDAQATSAAEFFLRHR